MGFLDNFRNKQETSTRPTTMIGGGVQPTHISDVIRSWFPNDDVTQQFATLTIETLAQTGLDAFVPVNKENVSALIQTFARGEAFDNAERFKSNLLFHFTYERDPSKAAQAGLVNPNALDEINAVPGNTASFSFSTPADRGYTSLAPTVVAPSSNPQPVPDVPGINDEILGGKEFMGVWEGGRLIKVASSDPDIDDFYIQVYDLPGLGSSVFYQFTDPTEVQNTFGHSNAEVTISEDEFFDKYNNTWFAAGEASEIVGAGSFGRFYDMVRSNALSRAGIGDPSLQGAIMRDPEIQNIYIRAAFNQNATAASIQAEVRQTNYWRNVLYPGIDFFYGRGDENPEQAWRHYEAQVSDGLRALGKSSVNGSYKADIGNYLRAGVSAGEFNKFLPIAIRVQNNPDLKRNLDAWAQIELGRNLNFNEFLNVLTGTSDAELERVIESATLAFSAERAGVNISVADIRRIAEQTDLTEAGAIQAFTQQERAILAIGNQELSGYGITTKDLLDVAVGATPRSGKSAAVVMNLAGKLATERGISDDPNARFFQGFNRRGQLERTGLQSLAQEGG